MQHVYLLVTTRSPVAIRSDHAEGGAVTTQHIPGTTVLGCLAAAYRILRSEQQEDFARLFLNEQVSFPSLYPALFNKSNVGIHTSKLPVMPFPKTAQSCKRFLGFKLMPSEVTDEKRHGIRDSLLDWGVFSLLSDEQQTIPAMLAPLEQHASCTHPHCNQAIDHVNGYYRCARGDARQRMKAKIATRLQTRTGINRDWGVVEDRILYNREVFDEGMCFWGDVILPDELASTFISFVKEANEEGEGIIRIGTGRTRGMGSVNIETYPATRDDITKFRSKLANFNLTMQQRAQAEGVKTLDPFYFAITLYSATILCDAFLRYHKTLDVTTLSKLLGYPASTFKKIYQSLGTQSITGWNEIWGTPRTKDYAIEKGSTFLFACSHELDDKLLQALYTLEETGMGRRQAEGFGRLCISDPFHLEGEQV